MGHSVSELLPLARQGNAEALERLFGGCRNYVRLVATAQLEQRLRGKFDPSDLVQQTFLDAYRAFNQFRGGTEAEWLAWLRQILAHNAADLARRFQGGGKRDVGREVRIAEARANGLTSGFVPADDGETPSQQFLRRERELRLADALAGLSSEHAEVIRLRSLLRLPFDEVAERMSRSRAATQMLWTRAVGKLRDLLVEP